MNQPMKWMLGGATVAALVTALAACGGGNVDDSFFQASGTNAGAVCIEGATISPNGQEAKDTVTHLKKFYGGDLNATTRVDAGVGFNATCVGYTDKPKADLIITKAYYKDVIVPATP